MRFRPDMISITALKLFNRRQNYTIPSEYEREGTGEAEEREGSRKGEKEN